MMRAPFVGWLMISVMNVFIEKILPASIIRKLTPDEMNRYREPFPTVKSRRPERQWPREIPIDGKPADVHQAVADNLEKLKNSRIPKLFFHCRPGAIISPVQAEWIRENIPNLKSVDLGKGLHYLQEDHPHLIGEEIATWYRAL
jgi:haloalkane dehalogenase